MLINCPNCNGYISSRASKCVHCGAEFPHYCEECNALLNKGDVVCSNCGCPVYVNFSEQNKTFDIVSDRNSSNYNFKI